MIHFLDVEASSLGADSFPIEVAWVDEDGHGESHLIHPAEAWLADGCPGWSRESQAIHGIELEVLMRQGQPVHGVAAKVASVLRTGDVFSDAPEWDAAWIRTLMHAGGQDVVVGLLDVVRAYGMACRPLLKQAVGLTPMGWQAEDRAQNLAREIVARAEEVEVLRQRVRHRALPDAEALWRTWKAVVDEVERQTGTA